MWESLIRSIEQLGNIGNSILETIVNVFSYIVSIVGFLFYAGKTLIVGVFKLLMNVLTGGVFASSFRALDLIASYIGGPAVVFIVALLFVIIIRIIVAFVFKILRLNIDYNSFDKNTRKANSWANSSEYHKKMSSRA